MKNFIKISLISLLFFISSCAGKINSENYEKISNGMSKSKVESILGKGESNASSNIDLGEYGGNISSEVMTWQSGGKIISITFSNGKVMAKAQSGL